MKFLTFVFILLSCVSASADVKSVIKGPETAERGDLIILDGSESLGAVYKWVLVKSKKVFLPVENGRKVVFASGTDGEYEFYLIVGGYDKDKNVAVEYSSFTVKIGDGPTDPIDPVDPVDPTPNPENFNDLVKLVTDSALTVDGDRVSEAKVIANAFDSVIPDIKSGKFTTPRELSLATNEKYMASLGLNRYLVWKEKVFKGIEIKLNEYIKAGKLVKMTDYETPWVKISEGFKTVK